MKRHIFRIIFDEHHIEVYKYFVSGCILQPGAFFYFMGKITRCSSAIGFGLFSSGIIQISDERKAQDLKSAEKSDNCEMENELTP